MRISAALVCRPQLIAAFAALIGASSSPVAAQGGTHKISGMVRSSVTDEPLAGAVVELYGVGDLTESLWMKQ